MFAEGRFTSKGPIAGVLSQWWNPSIQPVGKPILIATGNGESAYQGETGPGIFTKTGSNWTSSDREPTGARLPEEKTSWWDDLLEAAGKYGDFEGRQSGDPYNPNTAPLPKGPVAAPKPTGSDAQPGPGSIFSLGNGGIGPLAILLGAAAGYFLLRGRI